MCLSEIAGLSVGNIYDEQFRYLYSATIRQLLTVLPPTLSASCGQTKTRSRRGERAAHGGARGVVLARPAADPSGIKDVYNRGRNEDQEFTRHLGLFLTSYFREHITVRGSARAARYPRRVREPWLTVETWPRPPCLHACPS